MASVRPLQFSGTKNQESSRLLALKKHRLLPIRSVLIVVLLSLQLVTLAAILLANRSKTEAVLESHA